jgi:hypothetical protein
MTLPVPDRRDGVQPERLLRAVPDPVAARQFGLPDRLAVAVRGAVPAGADDHPALTVADRAAAVVTRSLALGDLVQRVPSQRSRMSCSDGSGSSSSL